jgi:hypothetical protein
VAEKTATKASISLTEGYYNESMGFSRRSLSILFLHCDIQYSRSARMDGR